MPPLGTPWCHLHRPCPTMALFPGDWAALELKATEGWWRQRRVPGRDRPSALPQGTGTNSRTRAPRAASGDIVGSTPRPQVPVSIKPPLWEAHFVGEEPEVQRGSMTCSRTICQYIWNLIFLTPGMVIFAPAWRYSWALTLKILVCHLLGM